MNDFEIMHCILRIAQIDKSRATIVLSSVFIWYVLVVFYVKADIVAQTRIVYHEKELLQLIHEHLLKEGKFVFSSCLTECCQFC